MQRGKFRLATLLAIAALFGSVLAGCGSDDNSGGSASASTAPGSSISIPDATDDDNEDLAPVYGGTITVGLEAETATWVPGQGNVYLAVAQAIYDPLVLINAQGEYEGFLAETLEPNDDLDEWTITLRPGITFHDGTPLDAETVKWNYDTLHLTESSLSYGALTSAKLQSVEVVDELTLKFNLSEGNAAFPDVLRGTSSLQVSRTAYEADPEGFANNPVGTGPFVFSEWVRDDRTVVERNPNWWFTAENGDQLPYLDKIVFRPIPDEESRVLSLESGDIQMMNTLRGSSAKRVLGLVDKGGYNISMTVGNTFHAALFNTLQAPVDDARVRVALAKAIDPIAVQMVIGDDGLSDPAAGYYSQDSPWFSERVAEAYPIKVDPDIEGAIALIEEYRADPERSDGKAPGSPIEVEYRCMPDPALIQAAQLYQNMWQQIGVEVSLAQLDQANQITKTVGSADQDPPFRGEFSISCWRSGGGEGDPLTALSNEFSNPATASDYTNFSHPGITEQLEVLRTATDFSTRFDAVEKIGLIMAEEMPLLMVSATPTTVGFADNIHGIANWTLPSGNLGQGARGQQGAELRFHQVFVEQ